MSIRHTMPSAPALVRACTVALLLLGLAAQPLPDAHAQATPQSFADLAEALSPAVVNISTSQTVERPNRPNIPDGPFEDLFRDFFERGQPRGPRRVQSLGSGFVISADGFVVTNNHVIDGADAIDVNFADGSSLSAELIGTDPKTDIALLKVEPQGPLEFVSFGDSEVSRVGDWVLAIGNPFGLGGSVSAGIISARNRDINSGPYDDFIQTDAAINRGNSGGPLFNLDGDVIGVNTAIISPTGGSIGIGFAVPSELASNVVDQLREFGETRRGWLGVNIQTVSDEIAEALGLEEAAGALVANVAEDGPAAAGGIEPGDLILRFDGQEVERMRDLPRMVADTPVGKTVRVVVFRKGKTQTLRVTLGRLEDQELADGGTVIGEDEADPADSAVNGTGMRVEALSNANRQRFNVPEDVTGVIITEVEPDGAAARKGLEAGQVIVEVGQEPVATPQEVMARIEDARSEGRASVLLLVQAGGDLRFVPLPIDG